LSRYLDGKTDKPIAVFVHHNPAPDALQDTERLLPILQRCRAVKALIFGHRHVYTLDQIDGMHLVNLPVVGYSFADGNPVGWVEAAFSAQGADLTLHAVAGETRDDGKTTSLARR
jgi:3',5'-cyclic-AMP phosphodiesterase